MDNEGNGILKLMGFTGSDRTLYFYDFTKNSYTKAGFNTTLNSKIDKFSPVDKHFASIIDLNNDCFADLMLVSYQESQNNTKNYQL